MRKIYNVMVALLIATNLLAQAPQKMSYQGVIRNANNNLVKNQQVGMKVSILLGSTDGTAVYVETQNPTTNDNGLVSIEIGGGVIVTGAFSGINWPICTYFIKTETDPNGGSNYSITGINQLLSVPYALHAKTAESISGYALSQQIPIVEIQAASNIERFSATINGKVNGNGFNTSVSFDWGLTSEYGNNVTATPSSINGSNDVNVATNLTGLQSNTTYHYKINATNAINTTKSNDLIFTTLVAKTIGDSYLGGKIAYLDASGIHGFVCALADQSTSMQWYNGSYIITGATNTALETTGVYGITKSGGRKNTDAIILEQGAGSYAASICASLTIGGATAGDWYLPSKGELNEMYDNRGVLGNFTPYYYWSSSENSGDLAGLQYFDYGYQYFNLNKNSGFCVRAIRAF